MLIHLSCLQSLNQNLDTIRRTFAELPLMIYFLSIYIYVFDIQEGKYVGELAKWSFEKITKTVKLLRFINHIIHTNDIDSFFKYFWCPSYDWFFKISDVFNNDEFNIFITKTRTRYGKQYSIIWTDSTIPTLKIDQKLFSNVANFGFESICLPTKK